MAATGTDQVVAHEEPWMMNHRPKLPRRKSSLRYPGYDYRGPGAYFVTICTQDRLRLFGHVLDGQMVANEIAGMVVDVWQELPDRYPGVALDAMIVMPDHLHAIVMLGTDPAVEALPSLGTVVKYVKGRSSIRYFDQVHAGNWPPVNRRLWQQEYFDRIVRSARELEDIRNDIEANPARWWERRNRA